jgi:predicted DNA repair protein MutK
MGYWLAEKRAALAQWLGKGLLVVAPWLMKVLSIVGTLAMFLVGGGIVVHGIAPLHHAIEHWSAGLGGILASLLPVIANLVLGFIIGAVVLAGVKVVSSLRRSVK